MRDIHHIAKERQTVNATIRSFFADRGYLEVETPSLVASPDVSPNLSYIATSLEVPGEPNRPGYFITSPEFSMKKLLGQGMEKIFTLARVFRNNEELGGTHNPEFTMLEWYTQGADYHVMMDETEALVREVCSAFGKALPPFVRVRVRDAMFEHTGVDLDAAQAEDLAQACDRLKIHRDASDTESDLFYRLFLAKVEPAIGLTPTFVYDYPLYQAALAAKTPDGRYAQRVELYIEGMELSNGFTELTNATEQRARFIEEQQQRRTLGKSVPPVDERLLELLPSVQSPTFGNALGLDRLHMLATGTKDIEDVLLFPAKILFS